MFFVGKQVIFSQIRNKSRKHVVGNIYRSIGNNADNGISKVSSVGSFDLSTITDLVANFVNTPYFGLFCVASLIPVYNVVLKKRAEPHKIEGGEFIKKYLAENEDAVLTKSGLVYHEMLRGTGTTQVCTNRISLFQLCLEVLERYAYMIYSQKPLLLSKFIIQGS